MPRDAAPEPAPAPARRFPAFAIAWLAGTAALYLVTTDAAGVLHAGIERAVAFTPRDVWRAPWRFVPALLGLPLARDAVQFAYVTGVTALGLVALEWRDGARRAAFAFLAGGTLGVLAVTFLVLLPLHAALPGHAVVAFSVERSYLGASTAAFAAVGALGARVARPLAGAAILVAAGVWELFLWGWYYDFAQLIPLYHYAALAVGFGLARSPWYLKIRA